MKLYLLFLGSKCLQILISSQVHPSDQRKGACNFSILTIRPLPTTHFLSIRKTCVQKGCQCNFLSSDLIFVVTEFIWNILCRCFAYITGRIACCPPKQKDAECASVYKYSGNCSIFIPGRRELISNRASITFGSQAWISLRVPQIRRCCMTFAKSALEYFYSWHSYLEIL